METHTDYTHLYLLVGIFLENHISYGGWLGWVRCSARRIIKMDLG